jgi:hypothetical protein
MKKTLEYNLNEVEEMTNTLVNAIKMSVTEINREYLIKVKGQGFNTLVGVSGLLAFVGAERAAKMLTRANKCTGDVCKCQVYGQDLQISFYIH